MYHGYCRVVRKIGYRNAIVNVFEKGSKLILDKLEEVIAPPKSRYTVILKAVAQASS